MISSVRTCRRSGQLEEQITQIIEEMASSLVKAEPGPGALSAVQILLSWSPRWTDPQRGSVRQAVGLGPGPGVLLRPHRPLSAPPTRRPPAQRAMYPTVRRDRGTLADLRAREFSVSGVAAARSRFR
jgi:hypothetical protein